MGSLSVLLQKEWRENCRNFKILWIPLVFIIFGIMEPLTNYYLPEIMKSVGNMPEGTEFMWPELQGEEIFVSLIGQYQSIGILVIVLAFMGSIAGERKSGTATLLYVRPISFQNYFLSKWLVVNGIVIGSVVLGFLTAWYYITILYDYIQWIQVLQFISIYSLWLIFVVTVTLALSAAFTTGITATLTLFIVLILPIIDSLIGQYWTISPLKLATYAAYVFEEGADFSNLWWSLLMTVILTVVLIVFGIFMSKRNAAKTTV